MLVLDRTGERLIPEPPQVELSFEADAQIEAIAEAILAVEVIGLKFPSFKDGRPFSLARSLRARYGFSGDLRALGAFIPDQAAFLIRCGFTSFEVSESFDQRSFRSALEYFPRTYQQPLGDAASIVALRHKTTDLDQQLQNIIARYHGAQAHDLLAAAITTEFPGKIALVSSFGAESAVLLHMLANIAPATPVVFLDTGKLFGETLRYRDALISQLGLTNVKSIVPELLSLAARDPSGVLWSTNADTCCRLRKVEPLARALRPFTAWITGRKGYQSIERRNLPPIELVDGKFKFNPLASWTRPDVLAYLDAHHLPRHPLEADGYQSIGCTPCTDRVAAGEDPRAGRWRGRGKTECGIHDAAQRKVAS